MAEKTSIFSAVFVRKSAKFPIPQIDWRTGTARGILVLQRRIYTGGYKMTTIFKKQWIKSFSLLIAAGFLGCLLILPAQAQGVFRPLPSGFMPEISTTYSPAVIKGITLNPQNPLELDFLIDLGEEELDDEAFEIEAMKLIKYFMASLTIPENEMWVNLSPYEADRIIPQKFGQTKMGQDLLAQDYILKQITASLLNPEDELGKIFWDRVRTKVIEEYGIDEIPLHTVSKVWIIPEKADIYRDDMNIYVFDTRLKVLLEEEYLSLEENVNRDTHGLGDITQEDLTRISEAATHLMKDILLPEIEKEVNEGKTFANLRQMYHSMILAVWYKKNLKESLLGKNYIDRQKINGIDTQEKDTAQEIYRQYKEALEQGAYKFIHEEYSPENQQVIGRKYFTGGISNDNARDIIKEVSPAAQSQADSPKAIRSRTVTVRIQPVKMDSIDYAMAESRASKNTQDNFSWKNEQEAISNIHKAIKINRPDIFLEYQEFKNIGKEFSGIKKLKASNLKEKIYNITVAHFFIWGLESIYSPEVNNYFERSYISALQKSFPELKLNPYAFRHDFSTEKDGIKSVQAAIERFSPEIWEEYQMFLRSPDNFNEERLKKLKHVIYLINTAHFELWNLSATSSRKRAPYFQGSYKIALQKSFTPLELEIKRFHKGTYKRFQWTLGLKQGIQNIHQTLQIHRPDVWREYNAYLKDKTSFNEKRLHELKEQIYKIRQAHFNLWGLRNAKDNNFTPYFEGSYIVALLKSFKELDLNPYAFKYDLTTEENGIKSIHAAVERYEPDLWREYQAYLKDKPAFDGNRLRELRKRFSELSLAHFHIWGIIQSTFRKNVPYFHGSYKIALQKSFPEIFIKDKAEEIKDAAMTEHLYSWTDEKSGINNVLNALKINANDIYSEYQEFLRLGKEEFGSERLHSLKNKIYSLTTADLQRWKLNSALNYGKTHYFKGSYIVALSKSLPGLNLNPYAFRRIYKTEEDAIKSIQATIERFEPEIWENYIEYKSDPKIFPKNSLLKLKDNIYRITYSHFFAWGIKRAAMHATFPYFEGSHIIALQKSFKELDLNPYAFRYKFETEEDGIKSVRAAVERFMPELWEEYQEYTGNPNRFDIKRLQNLKEVFYQIQTADFQMWSLAAVKRQVTTPYFQGSHAFALQKSFPDLKLNPYAFSHKYGNEEDAIKSVHAALERFKPDLWEEYQEYLSDPAGFGMTRLDDLKEMVYQITYAHFLKWKLSSSLKSSKELSFGKSYKTALIKSLGILNLDLNKFGKYGKKQRFYWKYGKEQGIDNIHEVIRQEQPDIWNDYLEYLKDQNNFEKIRLYELKNKIYEISSADFQIWGINASINERSSPYFEGSYIVALQESFPELKLNSYAFSYKFETEDDVIKSVQAALERFKPDLWEEYQEFLQDKSKFKKARLRRLKEEIYRITSTHFSKWELSAIGHHKNFNNFGSSYIIALQKSLAELDLNPYAFSYKFETEDDGIKSVRAAMERFMPDLWEEYQEYVKDQKSFTKGRFKKLTEQFNKINSLNLTMWGLHSTLMDRVSYFKKSHKVALQKSFPEIYAEVTNKETNDAAMSSSQHVSIDKNVGGIDLNLSYTELQEHGTDNELFSDYPLNQPAMVEGFYPVIINISPVTNNPPFSLR